jgi:hypothetical protein
MRWVLRCRGEPPSPGAPRGKAGSPLFPRGEAPPVRGGGGALSFFSFTSTWKLASGLLFASRNNGAAAWKLHVDLLAHPTMIILSHLHVEITSSDRRRDLVAKLMMQLYACSEVCGPPHKRSNNLRVFDCYSVQTLNITSDSAMIAMPKIREYVTTVSSGSYLCAVGINSFKEIMTIMPLTIPNKIA